MVWHRAPIDIRFMGLWRAAQHAAVNDVGLIYSVQLWTGRAAQNDSETFHFVIPLCGYDCVYVCVSHYSTQSPLSNLCWLTQGNLPAFHSLSQAADKMSLEWISDIMTRVQFIAAALYWRPHFLNEAQGQVPPSCPLCAERNATSCFLSFSFCLPPLSVIWQSKQT